MLRLCVLLLLCSCKIGDEYVARLRALGAASQEKISQLDDRRRAGVSKLAADPNPEAPLPCPLDIAHHRGLSIDNFQRMTYWCPYVIDFVITKLDAPKIVFKRVLSGILEGRVVVWSWEKAAPACWIDVTSRLPDPQLISFGDSDREVLGRLYRHADEDALKAIGVSGFPRRAENPLY